MRKGLIEVKSIIYGGLGVVKIELRVPWDRAWRYLKGASVVVERTIDLEVHWAGLSYFPVCNIIDNRSKGKYGVILSEVLPKMGRPRPVSFE